MDVNGASSGTRTLPTIISTRSVFGIIPSTSRRNLAWSADGQCLLVTRQGVTVATPYLITALPKPEILLDTSMQGGKVDEEEEEFEIDADADHGRRLPRPRTGELQWWMTAVGFDKGKSREEDYGWADVGDEFTGLVVDRDKERSVRMAVWSPPGLSDSGSPLIAIMSNTAQVSVFAPGDDLYTKSFVEIADLTSSAIDLLPAKEKRGGMLSMAGMLRVRATSMEWSPPVPLKGMVGIDGSVLAIGNRAGGIVLWSQIDDAFVAIGEVELGKPWAADMTWSQWTVVDDTKCTAQLAIATTDGAVWLLQVTRSADVDSGTWEVELGELRALVPADGRLITALQWLRDDFLVWAKPGSIHLQDMAWPTPKVVRLQRVGNWAGCNALGACVGLHLHGTTLTVVLSTLTHHLIHNATTEPVLAPHIDSLKATLSARDVFLDCARRRRRGFYTANDAEYTAHTAGWAPMDATGDIASWMAEPITFHNLDSATEVNRISDFVIADLKTLPEDADAAMAALSTTLNNPPDLLHHSPLRILMPHILRLLVCEESMGKPLCDLLSIAPEAADVPDQPVLASSKRALMSSLWGPGAPDSLRLRLVLAQWGQRKFPNLALEFGNAIIAIEQELQKALVTIALHWAAKFAGKDLPTLDAQYIGHLFGMCASLEVDPPVEAETLRSRAEDASNARCPACGSAVKLGGGGSAFCEKGHEWERCSVTHLLITSPEYRLCTVCPSVSLLPEPGDDLVQVALRAAIDCPTCGGRWARPL